jgi:hypothetical protein
MTSIASRTVKGRLGDPLLAERLLWYTVRSCAGLVARRMLAFGAVEA